MAIEHLNGARPGIDRQVGATARTHPFINTPSREAAMPTWVVLLRRTGLPLALAGCAVSIAGLVASGHANIVVATLPLSVLAIVVLHVPTRRFATPLRESIVDAVELQRESKWLLIYATAYPFALIPLVVWIAAHPLPIFPQSIHSPIVSYGNVIGDKLLLLLLPALAFAWRFGGVRAQLGLCRIKGWRRWVLPLFPILLFTSPQIAVAFQRSASLSPSLLVGIALVAVVYAGLPEEAMYRALLQTRLERLLGARSGIAVASLLFTLRHIPSRYAFLWLGTTGSPALDLLLATAVCMTVHLPFGCLLGYMWARYRNIWANVASHTFYDAVNLIGSAS